MLGRLRVCVTYLVGALALCLALGLCFAQQPAAGGPAGAGKEQPPPPQPEAQAALKLVSGATALGYQGEGGSIRFSRTPQGNVVQPRKLAGNRYYGVLKLKGRAIPVTADVQPGRTIFYFDLNGDGDLSNAKEAGELFFGYGIKYKFSIPFTMNVAGSEVPMSLAIEGTSPRGGPQVTYYNNTYLRGSFTVEGKRYLCAIIDGNTDGSYTSGKEDYIVIDFNGDGKLNARKDSAELYKLGEPFIIGDKSYRVTSVSMKEGIKVDVSSTPAQPKPYLIPGYPAIDFVATTLSGQKFRLSQLKGYPVVLVFGDTADAYTKRLLSLLNKYAEAYNKTKPQLYVIAIMLDQSKDAVVQFIKDEGIKFPVVYQGPGGIYSSSKGYRVYETPRSFWLDHEMIIRFRDLRSSSQIRVALQQLVPKANAFRAKAQQEAAGAKPGQEETEQEKQPAKPQPKTRATDKQEKPPQKQN